MSSSSDLYRRPRFRRQVGDGIGHRAPPTILQFCRRLCGNLYMAFEEGSPAAWLYDLLKPDVTKVVVCDQRKNEDLSPRVLFNAHEMPNSVEDTLPKASIIIDLELSTSSHYRQIVEHGNGNLRSQ